MHNNIFNFTVFVAEVFFFQTLSYQNLYCFVIPASYTTNSNEKQKTHVHVCNE